MLVATPRSPSLLILEPEMPQTGRHLPKSSRKEGTRLLPCRVIALHTRHRAAPPGSRWGGILPDRPGGKHVLCSPAPVLNRSLLDASPCGSGPFLSPHHKRNKPPAHRPGPRAFGHTRADVFFLSGGEPEGGGVSFSFMRWTAEWNL